ncbi:MAG: DUF2933 domain-containing protein [bacterium]|nr:DUF2933 domain-containing protein [bacterium]
MKKNLIYVTVAVCVIVVIVLFKAQLKNNLTLLLLLACPLMHLVMMKGMHGGHRTAENKDSKEEQNNTKSCH